MKSVTSCPLSGNGPLQYIWVHNVWLNPKMKLLHVRLANCKNLVRIKDSVNVSFGNDSHKFQPEVNFLYSTVSKLSINARNARRPTDELPEDSDLVVQPSCEPTIPILDYAAYGWKPQPSQDRGKHPSVYFQTLCCHIRNSTPNNFEYRIAPLFEPDTT
jgi:hypothetical protein